MIERRQKNWRFFALRWSIFTGPVTYVHSCCSWLMDMYWWWSYIQVNSEDMKYSTHLQAMQAIWNSGPHIKLLIRRKLSAPNDGNFSFSESMSFSCRHCRALIRVAIQVCWYLCVVYCVSIPFRSSFPMYGGGGNWTSETRKGWIGPHHWIKRVCTPTIV